MKGEGFNRNGSRLTGQRKIPAIKYRRNLRKLGASTGVRQMSKLQHGFKGIVVGHNSWFFLCLFGVFFSLVMGHDIINHLKKKNITSDILYQEMLSCVNTVENITHTLTVHQNDG